ncbi:LysR family transcriptional regulator [Bradyrhizobium sp. CIR3A]|uniref:LysR family transcriptional regulator n=1 Tax=Bradyrhizobium sp. CIR3A TaxID=2663838 RepID=UPI001606D0D6|nr:LysR family transcriptional regulator [Bradyrhizobium sp. CIR3A]
MDWDRIRIFLEVARTGQIRGAAKRLGLDHSTVARQLNALELDLGSKLLVRAINGSSLTPAGAALLTTAERVESEFLRVGSQLKPATENLTGTVRVGAPDGLGNYFLAPRLGAFAAANPGLTIQLEPLPRKFSLARREADVVVTLERPTEGRLICTKLTDFTLSLYGSEDYVGRSAPIRDPDDLSNHLLITYIDDIVYSSALHYASSFNKTAHRYECGSVMGQVEAVRAGHGVGVLHDYAAARFLELRRLLPNHSFVRSYWLISHPDSHDTPRVRAVHQQIVSIIRQARQEFVATSTDPSRIA